MGKAESFDDDRIPNPKMIFTDRDNPRRVFWNAYDSLGRDEFYVINFYGFGGIGKSRLCSYLDECIRSGVHPETQGKIDSKSLILNLEDLKNHCDKVSVLENLANQLENYCGYKFPLFKYALYVYYRTQGYSNDSPEIKKIQDNAIAATVIDALGLVPLVGGIGTVMLKGLDSLAASMRENVIKNKDIIKQLDNMSTEDISEELIKFFIKELREQTQKETGPVVIFLDTYEQLQNYVYQTSSAKVSEEWLWSRIGIIRRIPNVLWVLAGQRKVDWGETDSFWRDESNIIYEEIGEIKEADRIKEMLGQIGIAEEDIIDTIVERTRGVPVHLALCKDTYFNLKKEGRTPVIADFNMDYAQLAKRFIGGLNSQLKDIVDILACLETWTQDDIAEMNFSADDYEYILDLSFIKEEGGRYHMHKSVQEIVYKTCSPIIRKKCLLYFEKMLGDASTTTVEKKDYILKKLRMELTILEGLSAKEKDTAAETFVRSTMQYIEKYLSDYNTFQKLYSLIRREDLAPYVDEISGKKLDIYNVYHRTLNGEYAAVRNYLRSGKVYDNTGLDDRTKGLLFVSLGKYEITNKNDEMARMHLLEAYNMLEETEDLRIILDILIVMSEVSIRLEKFEEVHDVCDKALEMISKERMNTQLIHDKCNFLISKSKSYRFAKRQEEAFAMARQAEETLKEYESLVDLENDSFVRRYIILYYEFLCYYQNKGNQEQTEKYEKLIREYTQKAYELNSSQTNYRNLAISYRETAESTKDVKLKKLYFDKAIGIMRELYEEFPTQARLDELFHYNRRAIDDMDREYREKYIKACEDILANEKRFQVLWRERYLYHRSIFSSYYESRDWEKAESKLTELEQMLEEHKGRLAEEKYQGYLKWNYRKRGYLFYVQGSAYGAIEPWYKLYKLEKSRCEKEPGIQPRKSLANASVLLAYNYDDRNMYQKAEVYFNETIEIRKAVLAESLNLDTLDDYSDAVKYINNIYRKTFKHQMALENCNQVLDQCHRLYKTVKKEECLCIMAEFIVERGKMLMKQGQAEQVLADYQSFLSLVAKKDYLAEGESIGAKLQEKVALVQYMAACLLLAMNRDLETAKAYLMASMAQDSELEREDRLFWMDKIESRLISGRVERVYMTREEGLAYLAEADTEEAE